VRCSKQADSTRWLRELEQSTCSDRGASGQCWCCCGRHRRTTCRRTSLHATSNQVSFNFLVHVIRCDRPFGTAAPIQKPCPTTAQPKPRSPAPASQVPTNNTARRGSLRHESPEQTERRRRNYHGRRRSSHSGSGRSAEEPASPVSVSPGRFNSAVDVEFTMVPNPTSPKQMTTEGMRDQVHTSLRYDPPYSLPSCCLVVPRVLTLTYSWCGWGPSPRARCSNESSNSCTITSKRSTRTARPFFPSKSGHGKLHREEPPTWSSTSASV